MHTANIRRSTRKRLSPSSCNAPPEGGLGLILFTMALLTLTLSTLTRQLGSTLITLTLLKLTPSTLRHQKEHPEAAVAKFLRCASSLCPLHYPSTVVFVATDFRYIHEVN